MPLESRFHGARRIRLSTPVLCQSKNLQVDVLTTVSEWAALESHHAQDTLLSSQRSSLLISWSELFQAGQDHGRDLGLGHPQDALGNCDNFCAVAVWTPMKAADTLSDINTHSDKTSRTPYFLHNCECGLGRGVTAPEVEPGLVKSSNFLTPRGREYSAPRSLKKTPENMFTFVLKLAAAAKAAAKKFNKVVTRGSTQAAFATPTQVSVVPSGAPPTYREVYHTHSDDVDPLPPYVEAAHEDVNNYTETPAYEFRVAISQRPERAKEKPSIIKMEKRPTTD
ncbi:hypothetical protein C8R47DRAFT_1069225 [Mycena vitilis]|nr:hypothetical protein C8R47DRAFT_1069225 [Mycena vitilis]